MMMFGKALFDHDEMLLSSDGGGVAINATADEEKSQEAAKKRNNLAMANFTTHFASETTMRLAYKAQSSEWNAGKVSLVV